MVHPADPLRLPQQPLEVHLDSAFGAQVLAHPSHCPLLSDSPHNGPWCCRCSGLRARAPRGHWMTPPLQDPATYDSRPSAPTRRGTGRRCPHRPKPRSRSPGTPLRGAGSWPPVITQGSLLAFLSRPSHTYDMLLPVPPHCWAIPQTLLTSPPTLPLPLLSAFSSWLPGFCLSKPVGARKQRV